MGFSENLKSIREKRRLSQKKLADLTGVSQASINYWESGARTPKIEQVQKLASVLNIDINKLMGWDERLEIRRLEREEALCDYISTIGASIMYSGDYKYTIEFNGKVYEISDIDYEKLVFSINTYSLFSIKNILRYADIITDNKDEDEEE